MLMALRLTEDNVDHIVEDAKQFQRNLEHLRDELEFNAEDGSETYLIKDHPKHLGSITYTTKTDEDFHAVWQFTNSEIPNHYAQITRK
jgi:hypothetical protein